MIVSSKEVRTVHRKSPVESGRTDKIREAPGPTPPLSMDFKRLEGRLTCFLIDLIVDGVF